MPQEPEYPPYKVTFDGDLGTGEGSKKTVSVRGPHQFILSGAANVGISVALTREGDHDPGVPHLKVTIRRSEPNAP